MDGCIATRRKAADMLRAIDQVAFRASLLALGVAVEAACAGQPQGMGSGASPDGAGESGTRAVQRMTEAVRVARPSEAR